ncbi:MAG: DNA polymerase III subunit beta [Bacteroidia bacterium]
MVFIVSSSTLLRQLQTLSGVLNSSNTLRILDNFLFEIEKKKLTVSASDLESTMTTSIPAEAKDAGSIAIPAKLLLDILKALPDQPLTFTVDEELFGIEISSDSGKYKLIGQNPKEFPKVPSIDAPSAVELEPAVLAAAINKTIFATAADKLRPVMTGVLCQLSKEGTTFVATDAHKLVRYKRSDAVSNTAASFILPKKPLGLLKNILANVEGKVKMEYNKKNVSFSFDSTIITCRLIDGQYPNYEAVIPKDNPYKLTIDKHAFLSSIKRVSIFSNKSTQMIRLKIAGSELNISTEDAEYSSEANERLTCQYSGDEMEIGFNANFLIEMLSNLDCDEVCMELSSPNRAGIITPAPLEKDNKNETILMLVMPVALMQMA